MRVVDDPGQHGLLRRAAPVDRRRWASQDPSGRSCRCCGLGPAGSVRTRHNRSAPVADRLAPQRVGEEPAVGEQQHPRLQPVAGAARRAWPRSRVYAPTWAAKIACVPHSANASTRACGNAACSPLFTPGRPKNSAFVDACPRHPGSVPSIATIRRPASHTPGVARHPTGGRPERTSPATAPTPTGPAPGRSPTYSADGTPPPTRRPRQPIGQLRQHVLIRTLGVQRHPDREIRHHPRRQRPMTLLASDQPQRSPHRPDPAGTPGSAPPPTPDPTTGDPTPASSTQRAAYHQTTPM